VKIVVFFLLTFVLKPDRLSLFSFLPACAWAKPGQAGMRKVNKRIKKKKACWHFIVNLYHVARIPACRNGSAGRFFRYPLTTCLFCFYIQPLIRISG